MKINGIVLASILSIACGGAAIAQAGSAQSSTPSQQSSQAAPQSPQPTQQGPGAAHTPLQLHSIAPPQKLQFPPTDPKNFTVPSPTAQEVNAFLKQLWGYDPNRAWRVAAIQATKAPNVSRVTVFVGEEGVSHTPATTVFFVLPDGRHAIAGADVIAFGADPFASVRATLEQKATGPYRGSASSKVMLVEFADLECPHCKEASTTMNQLAKDFPNAKIVFENFPLSNVHPAAVKAAEYGVCVAKLKGNAAFFQYIQAVFDAQASLINDADQTLNAAAIKAGANAPAVVTCTELPATKAAVEASMKLGREIGVDQTPLLYVNGRVIPVAGVAYNTIKQIVSFAMQEDSAGSTQAASTGVK